MLQTHTNFYMLGDFSSVARMKSTDCRDYFGESKYFHCATFDLHEYAFKVISPNKARFFESNLLWGFNLIPQPQAPASPLALFIFQEELI